MSIMEGAKVMEVHEPFNPMTLDVEGVVQPIRERAHHRVEKKTHNHTLPAHAQPCVQKGNVRQEEEVQRSVVHEGCIGGTTCFVILVYPREETGGGIHCPMMIHVDLVCGVQEPFLVRHPVPGVKRKEGPEIELTREPIWGPKGSTKEEAAIHEHTHIITHT